MSDPKMDAQNEERLVVPDPQEESIDAATVRRHVSWWTRAQWTTDDGQWQIKITPVEAERRPMFSGHIPQPARVLVEVYKSGDNHEDFIHQRDRLPHASVILAKTKHTAQRAVAFYELVAALHAEEAFEVDEQEAQAELRRADRRQGNPLGMDTLSDALKDAQEATKHDTARQAAEIGYGAQDATWGPEHPGYDEMGQ